MHSIPLNTRLQLSRLDIIMQWRRIDRFFRPVPGQVDVLSFFVAVVVF